MLSTVSTVESREISDFTVIRRKKYKFFIVEATGQQDKKRESRCASRTNVSAQLLQFEYIDLFSSLLFDVGLRYRGFSISFIKV